MSLRSTILGLSNASIATTEMMTDEDHTSASSSDSVHHAATSNTTYGLHRSGLFPSLQEMALAQLIMQFDNIEVAEQLLKKTEGQLAAESDLELIFVIPHFHSHIKGLVGTIKEKVKTLCTHVVRGEKNEAEAFLIANRNILKILLKSTCKVETYAKGLDNHVEVEGTAFRLALGAEDVSQDGKCDLVLTQKLTTLNNINNLRINSKAVYVRCGDKLFYDDPTNKECKVISSSSEKLKQFDAELQPQNNVRALSEDQLKRITMITNHIHEEGMAQMLDRYLQMLPDYEEERKKQIRDQFPEGWDAHEEKRQQNDAAVLKKVISAISNASNNDNCESALQEFRNYLEPKEVIKTGKHFNAQLLLEALNLYVENYGRFGGWNSHKNNLFWCKIIGYIQRFSPACYAQAFSQGVYYIVEYGEKLSRRLDFRSEYNISFFPLDSDSRYRLGHDYAVWPGERGGASWRTCESVRGSHGAAASLLSSYVKQKTSVCHKFMPHRMQQSRDYKSRCSIM